jgi:hypothetical protein
MAVSSGGGPGTATTTEEGGEETAQEGHWVEFQFVDSAGNSVGGFSYEFTAPDGTESEGTVGSDGRIYWSGPDAGQATAAIKFISNARWSEDTAEVGQTVTMSADVEGYDAGTPATFRIYKRDLRGADELMDTIETETQADSVEADWEYVSNGESQESPREGTQGNYSAPEYYFQVIVERSSARSDLLEYRDYIEVEATDEDGNPIADEEYVLYLPNGAVRTGTLDGSGCLREENIPPGLCSIRFPNLPAFRDVE